MQPRLQRRVQTLLFAGLMVLLSGIQSAQAGVSMRNGNFYIGYTDVVFDGPGELKLERIYNSKTPWKGMFGWGWGSDFETYLTVMPDGTVVVNESGGGAVVTFRPPMQRKDRFDASIERIFQAARRADRKNARSEPKAYRKRLRTDAFFRSDEWNALAKRGLVEPVDIPVGTRLVSRQFGYQYIQRTPTGFKRHKGNQFVETFDRRGKLTRQTDANGNYLDFSYDEKGRLLRVQNVNGRAIQLVRRDDGLVTRAMTSDGRQATYRYDKHDRLVFSRDVGGHEYYHQYNNQYNMVSIGYRGGTSLEIDYHPRSLNENVKSLKERNGTLTQYRYEYEKTEKTTLLRIEVEVGRGQRSYGTSTYEYEMHTTPQGHDYTRRITTNQYGRKRTTVYNVDGRPTLIEEDGRKVKFEYDDKGRLTMKETPYEVRRLTYAATGKVERTERTDKRTGRTEWSQFRYDNRGNLIGATDHTGRKLTLKYYENGQIRSIQSTGGDKSVELLFEYEDDCLKPSKITLVGTGDIDITYTKKCGLRNVSSQQGRGISLQVTKTFQELLAVIRPAGVSLTM